MAHHAADATPSRYRVADPGLSQRDSTRQTRTRQRTGTVHDHPTVDADHTGITIHTSHLEWPFSVALTRGGRLLERPLDDVAP